RGQQEIEVGLPVVRDRLRGRLAQGRQHVGGGGGELRVVGVGAGGEDQAVAGVLAGRQGQVSGLDLGTRLFQPAVGSRERRGRMHGRVDGGGGRQGVGGDRGRC